MITMKTLFGARILLMVVLANVPLTLTVTLIQEPSDTMVDKGMRVILYCALRGLQANQEVVWQKNNQTISIGVNLVADPPIIDRDRYRIVGNRAKEYFDLRISETNRRDNGEYACFVHNMENNELGNVTLKSKVARVTVYYTPSEKYPYCPFAETGRELSAGEKISICLSEMGRPPVTLELHGDGPEVEIPPTEMDYTSVPGFALLIMNVSESQNEETYTCRARSEDFPFYTSTCSVGPLRVVFPPRVAIRPLKAVLSAGEEGVFVCEIAANPQPTSIEWTFSPPMERRRFALYDDNRTLQILRLRMADDNRQMVCTVYNKAGNASSERVLALSSPPKNSSAHDNDNTSTHLARARCREASGIIAACLVLIVILLSALLVIFICRCRHAKSPRSCRDIIYQKRLTRIEPIDANFSTANDDTHLISSGT